ncbi:MAG: hypothetical protein MJ102_02980 [Clostridia bacterium]|nr:hypothetical protein [Clostridia bacterium]
MKKRIITIILALCMLLPMLIACGKTGGSDSTSAMSSTEVSAISDGSDTKDNKGVDENGYELDSIPEGLNFNDEITFLMWSDYTMTEFYVEENNGDGIDSAIYSRNERVRDRLGVDLQYVECPGNSDHMDEFIKKAQSDYNGDREFDIYAGYSRVAPQLALSGYTVDLLSTKYFNVEKPWWPNALINECTFNNKLYFCSGDISTNLLWMMIGTFYNKDLYAQYGFEKTPEQMVDSQEWTMDVMFDMTRDIYIDADNDNAKSDADTYGAVLYQMNIDAFQTAAGIVSVIKNGQSELTINPDYVGERTANVCELVGNWINSPGVYQLNKTSVRNIFFEERALFVTDRCFIVAGKDNAGSSDRIEFGYGIVPNPKYNKEQKNYMTNVGHPFTTYAIAASTHNVDAASAVLEALGSESYRLVTPEVFESAMKFKYGGGSDAARMYDIIRGNISFDLGRLIPGPFNNFTTNSFRNVAISNPSGYSTRIAGCKNAMDAGIRKLTDSINALD